MTPAILLQFLLTTLAVGTPLLLAALGELIGERAGVLNIGLEGMMLAGAWAGVAAGFATHNGGVGLIGAIGTGMAMAAIFAVLAITLRADPIVVGTGLNLFALGLTGVANRSMIAKFGVYHAAVLPEWTFSLAGALLAPLLYWGFRKTRLGLKLRAVGEHPEAADAAGVAVNRVRWLATLCNGALCGAAGAFLTMANTHDFGEGGTAGRGFIALAIVIFGRWNPFGAVAAALLFGAADAAQATLQTRFDPRFYPLILALPYVLTLLTLAGFTGTAKAPAAL